MYVPMSAKKKRRWHSALIFFDTFVYMWPKIGADWKQQPSFWINEMVEALKAETPLRIFLAGHSKGLTRNKAYSDLVVTWNRRGQQGVIRVIGLGSSGSEVVGWGSSGPLRGSSVSSVGGSRDHRQRVIGILGVIGRESSGSSSVWGRQGHREGGSVGLSGGHGVSSHRFHRRLRGHQGHRDLGGGHRDNVGMSSGQGSSGPSVRNHESSEIPS